MTIQVVFTDDGQGVILTHSGAVNGNDLVAEIRSVSDHPKFPAAKYWISDRTECTQYDVSSEQVAEIAKATRHARDLNPDLLVALVSPSALQYGISRMLQNLTDQELSTTLVCETREEADAWISEKLTPA